MGRRELREELQSTWSVYVPAKGREPFTKKDVEDADERERAEAEKQARLSKP